MKKKEIINSDNFFKIKELLESEDGPSRTIGLSILDQAEFEKYSVYVLCLVKETFQNIFTKDCLLEDIGKECPQLSDVLIKKYGEVSLNEISFASIFECAKEHDSKKEAQFILDLAKIDFEKFVQAYNFPFLEIADISLTPKPFNNDTK